MQLEALYLQAAQLCKTRWADFVRLAYVKDTSLTLHYWIGIASSSQQQQQQAQQSSARGGGAPGAGAMAGAAAAAAADAHSVQVFIDEQRCLSVQQHPKTAQLAPAKLV